MGPAERKRRSRAKQKEDPEKWKEITQKEKNRSRKRRLIAKEKMKENPELRKLLKEKERLKKRRNREKKKAEKVALGDAELGSYNSNRTLRKAVIKTLKALPESPRKRQAIVKQIVKDVIPALALSTEAKAKSQRSDVISKEDKKKALNFFEHDDVSRVAPGRKDTISVKDPLTGKRTHVAKRHMNMSVAEGYQLFKEKYPEVKLGKSKFFELRPAHVRPMNEMPHNVCVCPYHANYKYMVHTLHKTVPNFPSTTTELLQEISCDIHSEDCMTGKCTNCFDVHDIVTLNVDMESTMVSWKYWKKTEKNHTVATTSGTLKELLNEIHRQTPKFKAHVFVKNQQSQHFEKRRLESTSTELVLQVDFAENFAILCQDEIQSAHWSHPQATMFTGCAWANGGVDKHSYIILSNEMDHDKYAVWLFMKQIIKDLKQKYPMMEKVFIFSDGCAAQFKNRFTLVNICYAQSDWGVNVEWSFFASSHGKGAMDGVGATAKRLLWSAIMTRRELIENSWDCYKYLKSRGIRGMEIYFIASPDIEEQNFFLQNRWKDTRAIPNIQKQHHFKAISDKYINFGITASSTRTKTLMVLQGKLKYSDVYSSSSDEDVTINNEALRVSEGDVIIEENDEHTVFEHINSSSNVSTNGRPEETEEVAGCVDSTGDVTMEEKPDEPTVAGCEDSTIDVMMEEITDDTAVAEHVNSASDVSINERPEETEEVAECVDSTGDVTIEEKPDEPTVADCVDSTSNVMMEETADETAVAERVNSECSVITKEKHEVAVAECVDCVGDATLEETTDERVNSVGTNQQPTELAVAECTNFASKITMDVKLDDVEVIKRVISSDIVNRETTPNETEAMETDIDDKTSISDSAEVDPNDRKKKELDKINSHANEINSVAQEKVKPGSYLLVKIKANKAKNKEYRFVAVCQGNLDNNSDVKVMFMISSKGKPCNKVFTMNEHDVSYININQIIKILPEPNIKVQGDRIYYEFVESVHL